VPVHRAVKYINLVIALLLVAGAGAFYWWGYRPLPQTSGEIAAPVQKPAEAVRDELGVPHIVAGSDEDLFFLQGFVTAQDRLFQMDFLRRRAAGRLAEILGEAALANDRRAQTLGMEAAAEKYARQLDEPTRRIFAAYARGVNFFLERRSGRLPVEFALLRYDPRPWRIADSLLVALEMFRTLSSTWRSDLARQALLESGDPERVRRLYPVWSGLEPPLGSNAWAVAGERTASGKPLLAGDPHLEFTVPPVWYQIHLRSPGFHVAGMSLPGLPGVIIGHNGRIAWSVTNLQFDVQDLYLEQFEPAGGRYLYRNSIHRAGRRVARLLVRRARPVIVKTWVTRHGPIVAVARGRHFALRWTALELERFRYPIPAINRAGGWEEFREALREFPGPALNFVYADVDGNIGSQVAGKLPIRDYDGAYPQDGAAGEFEWKGYIPFDNLPAVFNPPSGIAVSANQNPFPRDYPYRVGGRFAPGYRARRIRRLLSEKDHWTAEAMLAVQTDIYDPYLHGLARRAVAAWDRRPKGGPTLAAAVDRLRGWDGRMAKASPAALIARLLFRHLRREVAERAAKGAGLLYDSPMAAPVIEKLLEEQPQDWFADYDALLLDALAGACAEAERMFGARIERWQYGRWNRLRPSGGLLAQLPLIGRYFVFDSVALGGSPNTVLQVNGRVMPSARMVLDPADWDNSRYVLPFGESGQRFSKHFRDQWKAYLEGRAFASQYQQISSGIRLRFVTAR